MSVETFEHGTARSRLRREEERDFRVFYLFCFAVFLVAALLSRLLPRRWRFMPGDDGVGLSIFGEARTAANITAPIAFMR